MCRRGTDGDAPTRAWPAACFRLAEDWGSTRDIRGGRINGAHAAAAQKRAVRPPNCVHKCYAPLIAQFWPGPPGGGASAAAVLVMAYAAYATEVRELGVRERTSSSVHHE